MEKTIRCLQSHAFRINLQKSSLELTWHLEHLGIIIDTMSNCFFLMDKKGRKMREVVVSVNMSGFGSLMTPSLLISSTNVMQWGFEDVQMKNRANQENIYPAHLYISAKNGTQNV